MSSVKYTKELLEEAVKNSRSYCDVLRYLGLRLAGGTQSHITKRIKEYKINTDHFIGQGWAKGSVAMNKKSFNEVLILNPEGSRRTSHIQLKRAMIESGLRYICRCGIDGEWQDRSITLEINHIDGNFCNNLRDNLEFLCPNCHSQETVTNMPHKYRNLKIVEILCDCGNEKSKRAKMCVSCRRFKSKKKRATKITWPSNEELFDMLAKSNYTQLGKRLGVSDTAIRKRLKAV